MKKIEAKIIADSICYDHRITSMLVTFPRFILSELNTHRMLSKNSASSRAIPFEKMVKMVEEDPFIPIAWQKSHKGMQGTEYILNEYVDKHEDPGDNDLDKCIEEWLYARTGAVLSAKELDQIDVTKQLCNRLLEPFMWHQVLITATSWSNFFELRCPAYEIETSDDTFYCKSKKDAIKIRPELAELTQLEWFDRNKSQAEIHMQALAEAMWNAMNESVPKQLKAGEWHVPFGEAMNDDIIYNKFLKPCNFDYNQERINLFKIAIATARCARLSYMTFDNKIDYEKDVKLHNQLLKSKHFSPFEHCARAMEKVEYYEHIKGVTIEYDDDDGRVFSEHSFGWCNNFRGWIQYRHLIENFM